MKFDVKVTEETLLRWLEEDIGVEEPSAWITPRDKEILENRNKEAKMLREVRERLEKSRDTTTADA
jgi:hypothetical protein